MANGFFIGMQSDYVIQHVHEGTTETHKLMETIFFCWFWTELLAKFAVEPHDFFTGTDRHWNYFDVFLMTSGTIQTLAGGGGVG